MWRWFPKAWLPYAVLSFGMALTLLGTSYIMRTSRARDELEFRATAEETRRLIEIQIQTYIETLRAGVALFGASEDVSRAEFRRFVERLQLQERHPGIQGIGYAIRVPREEVNDPGRRLDKLAIEDIRVWPPGERAEYTSILYIEPLDRQNQRALGYDMFTEPVRRAAMERARDIGEPAASGMVTLVQELSEARPQPGFLIYVPVYRNRMPLDTVEERRAALTGYVYSPFKVDDLLNGILGTGHPRIGFQVFDGTDPVPLALMHNSPDNSSGEPQPTSPERFEDTYSLNVAGRPWTLVFTAGQPFDPSSPMWIAPLTLLGGLLISFALFGILASQYRARESAERHAAELRASEEALRGGETRLRRLVVLEREARAEAQAADRAKDEFLATLSHELRTPLNAMLGWINMLRAGKVREERRSGAMEVIERNARTQARLIEDLLDVSRIITGKVRLELHPLQVGPIAQAAVEALRPAAEAKGLQLHASVDPAIGPVLGDAARLQQILWNLLSNAIKFTPSGGHVYVDLKTVGNGLELSVRDTGVGIASDFLPHVFERFRQADSSTTRTHSGVGLGLAIVRHLVELHGGHISAESDGPEHGSLFVVRLPLAARSADTRSTFQRTDGVPLEGIRVLVVDDDVDTREMLAEALAASGAQVAAAGSAEEAMAVLNDGGADVLVSDIAMPDVDGYALIRRIRELPGKRGRIPAIALTAYARPEDREQAIDSGFQVHLPKPVEIDALQASLAELARRAG